MVCEPAFLKFTAVSNVGVDDHYIADMSLVKVQIIMPAVVVHPEVPGSPNSILALGFTVIVLSISIRCLHEMSVQYSGVIFLLLYITISTNLFIGIIMIVIRACAQKHRVVSVWVV